MKATTASITSSLNVFCQKLKLEHEKTISAQRVLENKLQQIQSQLGLEKENIAKKLKMLQAYLNIAKAHTVQMTSSEVELIFDEGKLARISVQINNSKNDVFAAQLYTEVTGQILYLKNEENRIADRAETEKNKAYQEYELQKNASLRKRIDIKNEAISFLKGENFKSFISNIRSERAAFDFSNYNPIYFENGNFDIGEISIKLPFAEDFLNDLIIESQGLIDRNDCSLYVPLSVKLVGNVSLVEYDNETEQNTLQGIQAILLNLARYYDKSYKHVVFIDPVRFNGSGLGCLSKLCEGKNSFISPVPSSIEEIRSSLNLIIDKINNAEHNLMSGSNTTRQNSIYIFHNFPQGYDDNIISKIRQLCVNAAHYGITVILSNNQSLRNASGAETLEYIKVKAQYIRLSKNGNTEFLQKDTNQFVKFKWFCAPKQLPIDVQQKFIIDKPKLNTSNAYESHFDLTVMPKYNKGQRNLCKIPYGIDADGNIGYLDFDNSNFATFICGAARSGKSTLLHTLITGILKNNHPDDVEIWLIDFKMTEFSRYTSNIPPHVRYIILDESPELVYDIVDRLTEILLKRQNIFKGKWEKLADVPVSKYMPSLLVIIDEFSVMSQILADSVTAGKDNYILKMQTLLAKGAALGLHFIFASQGFTSGSRGLNDFSKKQIQQRIALKTEMSEIKSTLDLQSMGDDDRARMEQLPVYHTLVKSRIPIDIKGNYLIYSKVLYIADSDLQNNFIKTIKSNVLPAPKYSDYDSNVYIDKKSMVIDGNKYSGFNSNTQLFENSIQEFSKDDGIVIFAGEPRRMMTIYPIIIERGYYENILIIGSIGEKNTMASLLLSIAESMKMQRVSQTILAPSRNNLYRLFSQNLYHNNIDTIKDIGEICREIRMLKERIENRIEEDRVYYVFGLENIFSEMMFSSKHDSTSINQTATPSVLFERRLNDEPDINTILSRLENGDTNVVIPVQEATVISTPSKQIDSSIYTEIYDARADFKFILTHGSKLGYRFVLINDSVGEFKTNKIESTMFKHRFVFRVPRSEINGIVDTNNAGLISELPDHIFRYTNGLDSLSFRPYLHYGIDIDGWKASQNGIVSISDDDDNYLL